MKTALLIFALSLVSVFGQTNIQYVDVSTTTTNSVTNVAVITITGFCTNADFTAVRTNYIQYGDPLPAAFSKVNNSLMFVESQIASNSAAGSYLATKSIDNGSFASAITNTFTNNICLTFTNLGKVQVWNRTGTVIIPVSSNIWYVILPPGAWATNDAGGYYYGL